MSVFVNIVQQPQTQPLRARAAGEGTKKVALTPIETLALQKRLEKVKAKRGGTYIYVCMYMCIYICIYTCIIYIMCIYIDWPFKSKCRNCPEIGTDASVGALRLEC